MERTIRSVVWWNFENRSYSPGTDFGLNVCQVVAASMPQGIIEISVRFFSGEAGDVVCGVPYVTAEKMRMSVTLDGRFTVLSSDRYLKVQIKRKRRRPFLEEAIATTGDLLKVLGVIEVAAALRNFMSDQQVLVGGRWTNYQTYVRSILNNLVNAA